MTLDLQNEIEDLFRRKIAEFLEWSALNWVISEKDRARSDEWLDGKSADFVEGYNAAIDGMKGAFECWNEEFGP